MKHPFRWLALLTCLAAFSAFPRLVPAAELAILPDALELRGPEAGHSVLAVWRRDGQPAGPADVTWTSSNPAVFRVEGRTVTPVGDGRAELTARASAGESATISVTVSAMDQPHHWDFRRHVQPVLSRAGCNSGACHGALAGKGGFRLTLRGYDDATDYFTLTKQAQGRRIELADPGRSLLLAKPSGALPHKGGLRFDVGSKNYRVLAEWIAAGAAGPADSDPRLERLELLPPQSLLRVGDQQPLLVRALYSDGRWEDVTEWAKFASIDESVARVDAQGRVEIIGSGEGAITAWFSSKIVVARATVPYHDTIDAAALDRQFAAQPPRNLIDRHVDAKLRQLGLSPSPLCSDERFIRRAYLDTIGVLPTGDEVRAFLADSAPDRRDQLIDRLLARPEFVDYWAYRWSDLLLINGAKLRPEAVKSFYAWIRQSVADNTPWDQFVREVVTATGRTDQNGAANFYSLHQDPETMTENVCQAFLGLSIACAKCHNHPLEKWTNDQYYGMAQMFARVRAKGWGGDGRNGDGLRTVYVERRGELIQPLTGKPQLPRPLDGEPLAMDAPEDRRLRLADWLTSPENPYFARSIANRVWANFFGAGLVEAVDDLRISNPASNEPLLAAAAEHLVAQKFDLKSLMRTILQSNAYQRSSVPLEENRADRRFYSRYYPRRLMAEVLLDAISQVTGVPTEFNEIQFPGADKAKTDFYPAGTRALQLYDSAVGSYFLTTFGRNQREITCECERSEATSMVQVLHLSNGDTINGKLAAEQGRLSALLKSGATPEAILEEAFLSSVSRPPTADERDVLLKLVLDSPEAERREAWEDVFWSVLSSREFLFNH